MSERAQNIYVYGTRLDTFLGRVQRPSTLLRRFLRRLSGLGGQAVPTVYLQCLAYQPLQAQGWPQAMLPCYLGVLLTARAGDEVLSLWMIAGKVYPPSPAERKQLAQARQHRLGELLRAALSASGVRVIEHALYHVPEAALQQIAPLCATWKAALKAIHLPAALAQRRCHPRRRENANGALRSPRAPDRHHPAETLREPALWDYPLG